MSDQGDKIIHLAREMLRGNQNSEQAVQPSSIIEDRHTSSIKAAALTALIAAFGSASLTHLIDEMRRPMNRYERIEIEALMFYAARQNASTEKAIQHDIEQDLSLSATNDLNALDYRRVRDYLREKIRN